MKIATSSASFSPAFGRTLTQLEWLDICANELEVDGIVFDVHDFPRDDAEYLAQLKKAAADLGLTVAALAVGEAPDTERHLSNAVALGAPLLLVHAPNSAARPEAWADFTAATKATAAQAKRCNVTLALRAVAGTLCENAADCSRLAKDIDSAWLRFAFDPRTSADAHGTAFLAKSVIAIHTIADIDNFATHADAESAGAIAALSHFRGFVVLEHAVDLSDRNAYHHAVARFTAQRARELTGTPQ